MQDVFIEYMVKKRMGSKNIILTILLIIAAIAVAFLAIVFSGALGPFAMLGPLIAVGAFFGAFYLISSMNIEYEYLITNGEMDVDQITAQRRRKRLITVNMRNVEDFNKYDNSKSSKFDNMNIKNKIMACDEINNEDLWYCVAQHKEKGKTLVIFNANERMLDGIKRFLPRNIMHEAFTRVK